LSSYCHELAKKLSMRYEAAPLPVNLAFASGQKEAAATLPPILADLPEANIDSNLQQEILRWSTAFSDSLILNKKKK